MTAKAELAERLLDIEIWLASLGGSDNYARTVSEAAAALTESRSKPFDLLRADVARQVAESALEGIGLWRSCSGCYETIDGYPPKGAVSDPHFGCILGVGCSECGGIGAVWDTTDYADRGNFLARDEAAALTEAGAGEALWKILDTVRGYDTTTASQADVLDDVDRIASAALTASPPPVQPVVKALEWWTDTGDIIADSIVGRYRLGKIAANVNFRLETPSGVMERSTLDYWPEAEAKAAAQADYEKRILSAISAPPSPAPGVTECATEGCERPATCRFERGGVGSHYCGDCFGNIVATYHSAEQPDDLRAEIERLTKEVEYWKIETKGETAKVEFRDKIIERREARVKALEEGLEPFKAFATDNLDTDDGNSWGGNRCERDRICDWFGPSEFNRARALLDKPGGDNDLR